MPEGHLIHHFARALRPFIGCTVRATSPQGKFTEGALTIDRQTLSSSEGFGKHLLLGFDHVDLHIHLGLAGSLFRSEVSAESPSGVRLRMEFESSDEAWNLAAPLRCELFSDEQREALVARLGPDPLRGDDPSPALRRMSTSRRPIGDLLLDQEIVAGIGNVLRAEALHLCEVHPNRPGSSLRPDDLLCLWNTLQRIMERAAVEGRIVTAEPPAGVSREELEQSDGRFVYKQPHCRTCGGEVKAWMLGKRMAYACESCQPPA